MPVCSGQSLRPLNRSIAWSSSTSRGLRLKSRTPMALGNGDVEGRLTGPWHPGIEIETGPIPAEPLTIAGTISSLRGPGSTPDQRESLKTRSGPVIQGCLHPGVEAMRRPQRYCRERPAPRPGAEDGPPIAERPRFRARAGDVPSNIAITRAGRQQTIASDEAPLTAIHGLNA